MGVVYTEILVTLRNFLICLLLFLVWEDTEKTENYYKTDRRQFLESGPNLHKSITDLFDEYSNDSKDTCRDAPIAVQLSGGLGNHLFGVAAGIELSLRRANSIEGLFLIKVDNNDFRAHQVHPLSKTLFRRLQSVDSERDLIMLKRQRKYNEINGNTSHDNYLFANAQILGKDNHWRHWCGQSYETFLQWLNVPCGTPQIVFGYLENKDFFKTSGSILKHLFAVPENVSLMMRERYLLPLNQISSIPWAIHVRRGDYLQASNWHNVLPLSYYEDAADMMISNLKKHGNGGGQVFVFSDDLEWVKSQDFFLNLEGVVFVDESDTLTVFYYLILASEGGVVCSASTFCWWSAFLSDLGRIPNRLVIFPDKIDIEHSFSGKMGPEDCGSVLNMPYMTLLSEY